MSSGDRGGTRGLQSQHSAEAADSGQRETSRLVTYKTTSLNNINSNHVSHRFFEGPWRPAGPQPSTSYSTTREGPGLSFRGIQGRKQGNRVAQIPAPLPVPLVSPLGTPFASPGEEFHDCKLSGCERVRINVSGQYFETRVGLLNRHPETILGCPEKRQRFYDQSRDELFIDRHRPSFEAIFAYFQYGGKLRRPHNVPDDIFLEELYFYELEKDVVDEYRITGGYTASKDLELPSNAVMKKIWMLFEYPETSHIAFAIAVISVVFTLISIVLFCVETLPVFSMSHCVVDEAPNFLDPFFITETACTLWFTLEAIVRFIVCPSKLAFWKDFKNIVDVTAIVPYYVTFFQVVSTMSCASAKSSASLSFLRVIRLVRIFKLTKHSVGLQVLILTFKASMAGLGLFLIAITVCLLVFSSAIYYAEFGLVGSQIHSIPDAFWWAIITMTTVGYGDKVPIGVWGRLIGCMCALVGVLTLAIPVPIITGNFNRFYAHKTGRGKHIWGSV